MNPPVKDSVTIPWMSEQEIPAIKLVLSAWRKLRKNRQKQEYKIEDLESYIATAAKALCAVAALNKKLTWENER